MSEPLRQLGLIADESDIVRIVRARRNELNISQLDLDDAAGLKPGYTGKRECGMHYWGSPEFFDTLQELGLCLIVAEDPHATARFAQRIAKRNLAQVRDVDAPPAVLKHPSWIARREARLRKKIRGIPWLFTTETAKAASELAMGSMTPKQRTRRARKAARIRWNDVKAAVKS
jgi:hypothetical protein